MNDEMKCPSKVFRTWQLSYFYSYNWNVLEHSLAAYGDLREMSKHLKKTISLMQPLNKFSFKAHKIKNFSFAISAYGTFFHLILPSLQSSLMNEFEDELATALSQMQLKRPDGHPHVYLMFPHGFGNRKFVLYGWANIQSFDMGINICRMGYFQFPPEDFPHQAARAWLHEYVHLAIQATEKGAPQYEETVRKLEHWLDTEVAVCEGQKCSKMGYLTTKYIEPIIKQKLNDFRLVDDLMVRHLGEKRVKEINAEFRNFEKMVILEIPSPPIPQRRTKLTAEYCCDLNYY